MAVTVWPVKKGLPSLLWVVYSKKPVVVYSLMV